MSVLITMFSINFDSKAAIITAVSSGNWDSPFTWDLGVPQCGDTVVIPSGITVTVTVNVDLDNGDPLCPLFRMTISGDLRFAHGKKMHLATGSCVSVEASGTVSASSKGGGASESIYIGEERVWQASGGTLRGVASLGCAIMLPVSLVDFNVKQHNKQIELTWKVASETNLAFYHLEYSLNGLEWVSLANVEQRAYVHDAPVKIYQYSTSDLGEDVYFRLTSVDNDGKQFILRIASYKSLKENDELIMIAPNPATVNQLVSVNYETTEELETTIHIVDQRGLVIYTSTKMEASKSGQLFVDTSALQSGTYFVRISNKNQSLKSKLAVL